MAHTEQDLCRKLLAKHHLNVPERRALPNGTARFSVFITVVQQALAESGWFPRRLEAGRDLGDGAVLESRDGELWVHEQHECGVMRLSPIYSYRVTTIAEAVRAYVHATTGSPIDGVAVDWQG